MRDIPAHPAQASAWYLYEQRLPGTGNVQLSLNAGERFAAEPLCLPWDRLVERHAMLRSSFRRNPAGELIRREEPAGTMPWRKVDWAALPPAELGDKWAALLAEDAARVIDPANGPLLRGTAIDLPGGHSHLLLTFPDFLLDEESVFRLLCEWLDALDRRASPDPEPASEQPTATPATAEWWTQFLSGGATPFALLPQPSAGRPRGAARVSPSAFLDREFTRELNASSRKLGVEPRVMVLGAWILLLSRLSVRRAGLLMAELPGSGTAECGIAANLLPVHASINGGQSVEAFFKTLAREEAERAQHAAIPVDRVLRLGGPAHAPGDFAACYQWAAPSLNDRLHDAFPRWINLDARLHRSFAFPVLLEARAGDRIGLTLSCDPNVVPESEAASILSRLQQILTTMVRQPTRRLSEIRILSDGEFSAFRAAETPDPLPAEPALVEDAIAAVAERQPDTVAIQGPEDAALTYGEIHSHASALAAWLRTENLADGWNIAVCLTNTPWLPVAVLGILRSGGTCVPLDDEAPAGWLVQKLDDCDVELVLCDSCTAPLFAQTPRRLLILDQQWDNVAATPATAVRAAPSKAAFVFVGTPGLPPPPCRAPEPGVLAAAVDRCAEIQGLHAGARIPLLARPGTGAFAETMLSALVAGATLELTAGGIPETASHLRLSSDQWRGWAVRCLRSSLPDAIRSVCVEGPAGPPGLLAAWRGLTPRTLRWACYASPSGFLGQSLHVTEPDPFLLGEPTAGLICRLHDPEGQPLPPSYSGTLEIAPASQPERILPLSAWRDRDGRFHRTFTPADILAAQLVALPGILDARVEPLDARVQPAEEPRTAWVVTDDSFDADAVRSALPAPLDLVPVREFSVQSDGLFAPLRIPGVPTARPSSAPTRPVEWQPVSLLHRRDGAPALFLVHGLDGDPASYTSLTPRLQEEWTLYATRARGLSQPSACHASIIDEAAALIEAICELEPEGPYHLFGHGFGAVLAFEMAHQLRLARRPVPYLVLAGSAAPQSSNPGWMKSLSRLFSRPVEAPSAGSPVGIAHGRALAEYRTPPLDGPAGILLAADQSRAEEEAWLRCAPEAFFERMSCPAADMLTEPSVKRLAVLLGEFMQDHPDERE